VATWEAENIRMMIMLSVEKIMRTESCSIKNLSPCEIVENARLECILKKRGLMDL
jgi:hypothetical protein